MKNVPIRAILLSGLFALGSAYTTTSLANPVGSTGTEDDEPIVGIDTHCEDNHKVGGKCGLQQQLGRPNPPN
jgi:hypothetical protein